MWKNNMFRSEAYNIQKIGWIKKIINHNYKRDKEDA